MDKVVIGITTCNSSLCKKFVNLFKNVGYIDHKSQWYDDEKNESYWQVRFLIDKEAGEIIYSMFKSFENEYYHGSVSKCEKFDSSFNCKCGRMH